MVAHNVKINKHVTRRSYSSAKEVLEIPPLTEVQTASYKWFLDKGVKEMFNDILPIEDYAGKLSLEYVDYSLGEPKYSLKESREQGVNYAAPLHVTLRLTNKETGEIKSQDIYFWRISFDD
ncbi:hypothetical protein Q757_08075 [Oenococcus alcoholitolerans]|uniref:DNA-directed RNA polymerase n=1 Tax=Oenococcus alcoholitolerans TaxID=931074 RepID=A0ABR4XPD3_9LACO|nr:hypothetical protein Q757_08075 [Oenococcus alcoholitolerans]